MLIVTVTSIVECPVSGIEFSRFMNGHVFNREARKEETGNEEKLRLFLLSELIGIHILEG